MQVCKHICDATLSVFSARYFMKAMEDFFPCLHSQTLGDWENSGRILESYAIPRRRLQNFINFNSINWPAPNIWVFIAQLVEHCSANAEAMGSNPVEALKFFSGLNLQLLKLRLQLRWSNLYFKFYCYVYDHISFAEFLIVFK